MSKAFRALALILAPAVVAIYPLLYYAGANTWNQPTDWLSLGVALAACVAVVTTALKIGGLIGWTPSRLANALALTFFAFGACRLTVQLVSGGHASLATQTVLSIAYGVITFAMALRVARPWLGSPQRVAPTAALALVLVLQPARSLFGPELRRGRWQQAARQMTDLHPVSPMPASARRDIYYIILDSFGSQAVLDDYYGVNSAAFRAQMTDRGFRFGDAVRSNYTQTFLSLASTLNLSYLDANLIEAMKGSADRRPLKYLIDHNRLFALAKQQGYRVVVVGSDIEATRSIEQTDVCICGRDGATELEQLALLETPLGALPLSRWAAAGHRRSVMDAFAAIRHAADGRQPTLVFAHVVSPHPPFVFTESGAPAADDRAPFLFNDGSSFPGSNADYVAGYRRQVQFVMTQVSETIAAILDRPGADPVIVIHGDHGPGSRLDLYNAANTDMHERTSVLYAYRFPGQPDTQTPASLVNGLRQMANTYLGADLPLAHDESYYSTFNRPYDFTRVPDAATN